MDTKERRPRSVNATRMNKMAQNALSYIIMGKFKNRFDRLIREILLFARQSRIYA